VIEVVTTYSGEIPDAPPGQKNIWLVDVSIDLIKSYYSKKYKEKKVIETLYVDNQEKDTKSWFYSMVSSQLELKEKDEYKIVSINKKQYISFTSLPTQVNIPI